MNSQTFKVRFALASWVKTSFLPPGTSAFIIAEASRKFKVLLTGKSNGKGKARQVIIDGNDNSGSESENKIYHFRNCIRYLHLEMPTQREKVLPELAECNRGEMEVLLDKLLIEKGAIDIS